MEAAADFSQSSAIMDSKTHNNPPKVLTTCPGQLCTMYLHSPTRAPRKALLYPYLANEETEAQWS